MIPHLLCASVLLASTPDAIHIAWVEDPSTTATIIWRTDEMYVPSAVQYRKPGQNEWQTATGALRPAGSPGVLHEVTLRSLAPSTAYEYRVKGLGQTWSETYAFRTAPPPAHGEFEVVFVADTGMIGREDGLATGTRQVIQEIAKLDPLLVLLGGDYAYYSTDQRWGSLYATIIAWFNQMKPVAVRAPMMPTYGNHEIFLRERYLFWAEHFPTPEGFDNRRYYSFDVGDAHFVSILAADSERGAQPNSALRWIESDIEAARKAGKRWIIPYFHVSPFSDGANHPSNLELRAQLGPLFERFGVKVALSTHDQSYERTYPLRGVPDKITSTSTSTSCYTMSDGVTWLKVSPGGKMSNINRSFSSFATNPAPPWTAFRDNTMHHFARLVISSDTIRVDVFGVKGDGSPPVLQDTFRYAEACSE